MASVDFTALSEALGRDSPAARQAIEGLSLLYREMEDIPPVANSYMAWVSCRGANATDSDTFVRHTLLSLLCRLVAYRFLEPLPSDRHLWEVINGDYFAGEGIGNFLGEDFFSWPYFRRSMGIGEDLEALEVAGKVMSTLQSLDFRDPSLEMLADLKREYPDDTNGQAFILPEDALAALSGKPVLSCFAPRCGVGTALAQCVRTAVDRRLHRNEYPLDSLLGVSVQFLGMTPDPLDAVVASTAFLFALGETAKGPHPPILIPVYLAEPNEVPKARLESNGERSYAIDAAGELLLPEQVAADPVYLDWLFGRLPNYMRGTALRLRAQAEEVALQEVLNAWYNYLTSPKARTPIPESLTPGAADVMVEAARSIIKAYVRGSGPAPLHLARNRPAPLFAARREFDLTIP